MPLVNLYLYILLYMDDMKKGNNNVDENLSVGRTLRTKQLRQIKIQESSGKK